MAEMALTFLTPIIEEVVSKIVSLVKKRVGAAMGLEKELDRLCDSLTLIQSIIQHAEERQESDLPIRRWLQKVKDVAYEITDALGECEYKVLKHKVKNRGWHWNPESISFSPLFRNCMAGKIKDINRRLDNLKSETNMINLVVSLRGQTCPKQHQKTDSFPDSSTIFGREDDVLKILSLLHNLRSQHTISGIAIIGMAGIGKTTVAKSIYNKIKKEKHYDLFAWVCVSEGFNEQNILGEMLRHFDHTAALTNNTNALLEGLAKELEKKTLFLILDDVWNENPGKWELFGSYLLKVLKTTGSSIVITTRSGKVASVMESVLMQSVLMPNYDMDRLSDDECWLIIKEKFLRSSIETSMPLDLEAIGQDIAKKCGGLPLVASVIAGTLRCQTGVEKWRAIRDDKAWNLNSRDADKILSILKISFDHLPSYLKKCFSYCSIFPKDFVIDKDDLVQLWMAQGFLYQPTQHSVTMEDIGNEYFDYLLSNSLFQDVEMDKYGNIISCKMHDAVVDLALFVSKGDTFVWEVGCKIDKDSKIRHLRVKHVKNEPPIIPRGVVERLHSLFLDEVDVFVSDASYLKSLRALKIEGAKGEHLIKKLKHLKYLNISSNKIKVLPKSFSKLYNLQTFRLMRCSSLQMSDEMRNLINLRHFYFDNKELMPREIGHLTSLQTLPLFFVSRANLDQLGYLSQLRGALKICDLKFARSKLEVAKADLIKKEKLHSLEFQWRELELKRFGFELEWRGSNEGYNNYEVLEGLTPPSNLKHLKIEGYNGEEFPSWLEKGVNFFGDSSPLNNLLTLKLSNCDKCVEILSLGFIPKLEDLEIEGMPKVKRMGSKFCLNRSYMTSSSDSGGESITLFPALKNLTIRNMETLEEWVEIECTIVFPCLEDLCVENCPNLKTWSMGGFSSHHKLSKVVIYYCPKLAILPSMEGLLSVRSLSFNGLGSLPSGLGSCSCLKDLGFYRCHMSFLSLEGMISLEKLAITGCEELICVSQLKSCIFLQELNISNCPNLISISEDVGISSLLTCFEIYDCRNLKCIPEERLGRLSQLKKLVIGPFWSELEEFPGLTSIHQLHASFEELELNGWDKLKSLPHQLQHLTALKTLELRNFNGLEALPEWLGDLFSLHKLEIRCCSNLTYLPSIEAMRRLSNLQYLRIYNCPKVNERCAKNRGLEWPKISHIPNICIDIDVVQGKYKFHGATKKGFEKERAWRLLRAKELLRRQSQ